MAEKPVLNKLDGIVKHLHDACTQLEMAGDCIERGLYDEALLHCRSLMRQKLDAIEEARNGTTD